MLVLGLADESRCITPLKGSFDFCFAQKTKGIGRCRKVLVQQTSFLPLQHESR